MSAENPITTAAKATQEIAKTAGKAIDATERAARFVSGPIKQVVGMLDDKLRFTRWERRVRLIQSADKFADDAGIKLSPENVPLNLAVDLMLEGSLEEDDDLQDRYAALLTNAADADAEYPTKRMHVFMLKQMGTLEVRILDILFVSPGGPMIDDLSGEYIEPSKIEYDDVNKRAFFNPFPEPKEELQIALENLTRLGCIRETLSFMHGVDIRERAHLTKLGKSFVGACKAAQIKEESA